MNKESLIQHASSWLTMELFDELPDPTSAEAHFRRWMTGFQRLKVTLPWGRSAHRSVGMAHREANWFFAKHIRLAHHTEDDRIISCYRLSRALLMACGHFPTATANELRTVQDDPQRYLTVESLLNGHCSLLMTGLTEHRNGICRLDKGYDVNVGFCAVNKPILALN